VYIKKIIFR